MAIWPSIWLLNLANKLHYLWQKQKSWGGGILIAVDSSEFSTLLHSSTDLKWLPFMLVGKESYHCVCSLCSTKPQEWISHLVYIPWRNYVHFWSCDYRWWLQYAWHNYAGVPFVDPPPFPNYFVTLFMHTTLLSL